MADLSNVVIWMVSTCPLISKSPSPFIRLLGIFPSSPSKIGTIVFWTFRRSIGFFFGGGSSLPRSRYLSLFSFSFNFNLCPTGTAKSTNRQVLIFFKFFFFLFSFFLLLTISTSSLGIRLYLRIPENFVRLIFLDGLLLLLLLLFTH